MRSAFVEYDRFTRGVATAVDLGKKVFGRKSREVDAIVDAAMQLCVRASFENRGMKWQTSCELIHMSSPRSMKCNDQVVEIGRAHV